MNDWKNVKEETEFDTALYGCIYTKPNESYCHLTREKDDVSTFSGKSDELYTKIDRDLPFYDKNVWECPDGYQFVDENGNVINATTIALEKKKPKYPTTYEECCRIVNANPYIRLMYDLTNGQKYSYDADNLQLYESIRKLRICRDAYWKIYGEEMGLDAPWKPDWQGEGCYVIVNHRGDIVTDVQWHANAILAFPTEEMRDFFFEHFKKDIEQCKEFL